MTGDHFIAAVIVLQGLAGGTYLWRGDWKQAIVWGGVAASNVAYLLLNRE